VVTASKAIFSFSGMLLLVRMLSLLSTLEDFFMLLVTGVFASDESLSVLPIKDSFVSCQLLHQSQFPSFSTKSEAIELRHEKREIPKTGEQSWIQICR
jgi:hypothetical protein